MINTIKNLVLFFIVTMMSTPSISFAQDNRQHVNFPAMMKEHMMGNMRDHLLAIQEITHQLATQQFDLAADTAEIRLGMSSLTTHGASHMGKLMPKAMAEIGTKMHHAASQFAITAKNVAIDGKLEKAFEGLSNIMQQCVACHSAYKIH